MKIGDCFLEVKDGEAIVTNGEGKSVTISEHEVWKQLDSLLRKENELEDIKGQKFGDFTAIERVRVYPSELWLCECDAGHQCQLSPSRLRMRVENNRGMCWHCGGRKNVETVFRADGSSKKTYNIWQGIKQRCYNPKNTSYKNYGARGIKMDIDWIDDFQAFFQYVSKLDHYNEEGRTLDRINNDGDYTPGNIRWATAKEQANNKRPYKRRKIQS
jgi:hypothetical protein